MNGYILLLYGLCVLAAYYPGYLATRKVSVGVASQVFVGLLLWFIFVVVEAAK